MDPGALLLVPQSEQGTEGGELEMKQKTKIRHFLHQSKS